MIPSLSSSSSCPSWFSLSIFSVLFIFVFSRFFLLLLPFLICISISPFHLLAVMFPSPALPHLTSLTLNLCLRRSFSYSHFFFLLFSPSPALQFFLLLFLLSFRFFWILIILSSTYLYFLFFPLLLTWSLLLSFFIFQSLLLWFFLILDRSKSSAEWHFRETFFYLAFIMFPSFYW